MVQLKQIGVFSCAKVSGILYAAMGLIIGLFMTLFSLALGSLMESAGESGGIFGVFFGVGSIILLPIFYGVLGFIGGALMAWIYNLIAGQFGGIEMEFEDTRAAAPPRATAPEDDVASRR
jgi:hypothetical protein